MNISKAEAKELIMDYKNRVYGVNLLSERNVDAYINDSTRVVIFNDDKVIDTKPSFGRPFDEPLFTCPYCHSDHIKLTDDEGGVNQCQNCGRIFN